MENKNHLSTNKNQNIVPTKANSVPQVHPTPNQIHRKSAVTKREKSIYTKQIR
jgi:hypothetical protein